MPRAGIHQLMSRNRSIAASAIFLILELSQPYTGLFRTSPAVSKSREALIRGQRRKLNFGCVAKHSSR
jgi:hypothetical protein